MNKYYIPELDEFHVGFEFEYKDTAYGKEWNNDIIIAKFENGWECNMDYHLSMYEDGANEYRVKYLDREDIQSLGFNKRKPEENNKSNDYFKITPSGNLGYWTEVDLDFRWGLDDISIRGVRGHEDDCLFRGIIKNKSELKKLLKQLKIID